MNKIKRICRRLDDLVFYFFNRRKGYSKYYTVLYRHEMKEAYKKANLPKKEKDWAFKRGFNPWRIRQYGLNENNYRSIISDRDYFYLYPINNSYSVFIDNKLTTKYILAPFDKYMPKYYFHILNGRGIMKLMDCPKNLCENIEGVLQLLEREKILAVKQAAGTYGVGFYKITFDGNDYFANNQRYSRKELSSLISGLDNYIITEYVIMHPELAKINPNAVNTVRVTLINEHGNDPIIPFAFWRIGTKKSGSVDNVAQGGMVCKVDVKTGRFYDGQVLVDHVYSDVKVHPDSGVELEGYLPNWSIVINELINISNYLPQLKWLGFDIAITEDGFKIIEINSHHGLHKAHEYPKEITAFLFRELEAKKKKYGC